MLREPNVSLKKAVVLGQSAEQTKIHAKELKQEAGIYRIKSNKKEYRYSQPEERIIKQCKYCGRSHMKRACPAFHQTCYNYHKKGHFANVCMSTNKSLNYLDTKSTPPTTPEEALDEDNFFIGAILIFQYQRYQHLLQNRLWRSSQCNSRKPHWNSANKIKNSKINNHPKLIQRKQYTSKRTVYFRYQASL